MKKCFLWAVGMVICATCGQATAEMRMWYKQPAPQWDHGIPIGNGRLGAMVWGGTEEERIQLNEDTIWAGAPLERDRKGAQEHLAKIRELLFAGEVVEAQAIANNSETQL